MGSGCNLMKRIYLQGEKCQKSVEANISTSIHKDLEWLGFPVNRNGWGQDIAVCKQNLSPAFPDRRGHSKTSSEERYQHYGLVSYYCLGKIFTSKYIKLEGHRVGMPSKGEGRYSSHSCCSSSCVKIYVCSNPEGRVFTYICQFIIRELCLKVYFVCILRFCAIVFSLCFIFLHVRQHNRAESSQGESASQV